jgi:membrane protease YdiL (CAAX protease family)
MEPGDPSGPAPFPNLWQGGGIALVYLALQTWMGAMVAAAAQAFHFPLWVAMVPGLVLGFPLALLFGLWLGRLDLWDILALRRVRPGVWLPLVLAHVGFFLLIAAFVHGVGRGLDHLLPESVRTTLFKEADPLASAPRPVLALLVLGAVPAEEILFRGLLLRGFLQRHRPALAVWASALLFMAAHGNPIQFPVALMIGATAGWYYQETGSLWPGLVAHGLQNLLAVLWLQPEALDAGSFAVYALPPLPWLLAAPFAAAGGLLWLRWIFRRPLPPPTGVLGLG